MLAARQQCPRFCLSCPRLSRGGVWQQDPAPRPSRVLSAGDASRLIHPLCSARRCADAAFLWGPVRRHGQQEHRSHRSPCPLTPWARCRSRRVRMRIPHSQMQQAHPLTAPSRARSRAHRGRRSSDTNARQFAGSSNLCFNCPSLRRPQESQALNELLFHVKADDVAKCKQVVRSQSIKCAGRPRRSSTRVFWSLSRVSFAFLAVLFRHDPAPAAER